MKKEVLPLNNEKFQVTRSSIQGLGVFTTKTIKKGGIISFLGGKIHRFEVKSMKDSLSKMHWIGIGKNTWIDPDYPYQYVNHSCSPSATIIGKKTVIALKDLKHGDEITFDYSLIEGDPLWYMHCQCGSKNCRKIIRSVNFLPKRIFKKYEKFMPKYFRNLYVSNNQK